jgi:hypothetical protein
LDGGCRQGCRRSGESKTMNRTHCDESGAAEGERVALQLVDFAQNI